MYVCLGRSCTSVSPRSSEILAGVQKSDSTSVNDILSYKKDLVGIVAGGCVQDRVLSLPSGIRGRPQPGVASCGTGPVHTASFGQNRSHAR